MFASGVDRGGRKTYEVSKFIAKSAAVDKKRCVILRDEKELIRETILNDILNRYDAANQYGHLSLSCDRLDTGIKDKKTNEMLVFTKGFRASDRQKIGNLKGSSNIDIAVIEEAEDIRDETKFSIFHDSLRKEGSIVIIILNTPDILHWIVRRYFNLEQVEDGFYKIIPKEIPGFLCIQTSFEDNPYLPDHIINRYRSYGDPDSHLYNKFYFLTAIKGLASTGRKGQILTKVKPIKLADYLALPFKEIYGQDFGTARPAGLVGVKIDSNNCYCRQINYLPMNILDIGKLYCRLNLDDGDVVIADSAEPTSIGKLRQGWPIDELPKDDIEKYPKLIKGWNVYGVAKPKGCIKAGLDIMDGMNLYAVEESTDLWNEIMNYIWAVDKNNNPTGEPMDEFNHIIDPWRYVVFSRGRFY